MIYPTIFGPSLTFISTPVYRVASQGLVSYFVDRRLYPAGCALDIVQGISKISSTYFRHHPSSGACTESVKNRPQLRSGVLVPTPVPYPIAVFRGRVIVVNI